MRWIIVALALSGCAGRELMGEVVPGMTRAQVVEKLGQPEGWQPSQARPGMTCGAWNLWRPFIQRGPGQYTDRYFVCFEGDRVVSSGRAGDTF
jgi:hypothetical protein